MTNFDKKLKQSINNIQKEIRNLKSMGFKIELDNSEYIMGKGAKKMYVTDYSRKKIIMQEYLFSF